MELTVLERAVLVAAKLNEKADRLVGQSATKEEWLDNVIERAAVPYVEMDYDAVLAEFKKWNWRT